MGKYKFNLKDRPSATDEFNVQVFIANELSEANRLKRLEIQCIQEKYGYEFDLEDRA